MNTFSNLPIPLDQLPSWEAVEFTPISKKYRYIVVVNFLLSGFIIVGLGFLLLWTSDGGFGQNWGTPLLLLLVFTVVLCLCLGFNLFALQRRGYAVRERDVLYRAGVYAPYTMIIPYRHIQHVNIKATLLQRRLGIVTIALFTAGAGRDMMIAGVEEEKALVLQQYLSKRISSENAGVDDVE